MLVRAKLVRSFSLCVILVHTVLKFVLVKRDFANGLKLIVCTIALPAVVLFVVRRAYEHPMLVAFETARRPVLVRVDVLNLDVFEQLVVVHVPLVGKANFKLRQVFSVLERPKLHALQFESVLHELHDKLALFFLVYEST